MIIEHDIESSSLDEAPKQAGVASRGHARPIDKELLRVDPWVMAVKVAVFVLLLSAGYAGILSGHIAGSVLGTLLVGAMFAHGVELTHQFLHGTGFRNRTANRVAGFLCALPMLVSHSHYKSLHLAHHRNLGTPANKEFFNYGNVKGKHPLVVLARSFSLGRYLNVAKNILGALAGKTPDGAANEQESRAIRLEYLAMLAVIVGAIAFTAVTRSDLALRLWVLPLLLVAEPVHFWVELPEHFGCELSKRSVLVNTRTIRGSWLSFWFTNGNNFHVEHHLYPRVAIDKLPRVHTTLRHDIQYFNRSYWSFLRTVFSREVLPSDPIDAGGLETSTPPPSAPERTAPSFSAKRPTCA
ncbi:MAG TPA: fatty acid desaturase [Sorangium sp.]|nr:fatty acid desaturase [Sorangium sp.]